MKKPILRHCDECRLWKRYQARHDSLVICRAGHRPRFYQPRSPVDETWGFKRTCGDFKPRATVEVFSC